MISIEQLECFLLVSETLSFTQTAKRLYLSQPTVTYQIKNLEESLGVQLLIRNGKKVELSQSGKSLRQDLMTILPQLKTSLECVHDVSEGDQKPLVLTCTPVLFSSWVIEVVKKFNSSGAAFHIVPKLVDESRFISSLLSHEVDAAFCTELEFEAIDDLEFFPILETSYCVFAPKSSPLTAQEFVSLEDLASNKIIIFRGFESKEHPYGNRIFSIARTGIDCEKASPADNSQSGMMMAAAGLGLYIGLDIEKYLGANLDLAPIPLETKSDPFSLGLALRKGEGEPFKKALATYTKQCIRAISQKGNL